MAIIHLTTMAPTKLELLTSWLPGRPWYLGDRIVRNKRLRANKRPRPGAAS